MSHTCHAHGCVTPVNPSLLMCARHWFALPMNVRRAVLREYRPGQERDKKPSHRYMAVQRLAVCHSAFKKNDEAAAVVCAEYLQESIIYQRAAIDAGQGDPLEGLIPPDVKRASP